MSLWQSAERVEVESVAGWLLIFAIGEHNTLRQF